MAIVMAVVMAKGLNGPSKGMEVALFWNVQRALQRANQQSVKERREVPWGGVLGPGKKGLECWHETCELYSREGQVQNGIYRKT